MTRSKRCLEVLIGACLLSSCSGPEPAPKPSPPPAAAQANAGVELTSVRYELSWLPRREAAKAGGGSGFTTDLGYVVELERALLSNYSVELVPCAFVPAKPVGDQGASLLERVFGLPIAHAGHTTLKDPSSVRLGLIEDMLKGVGATFGEATFQARRYCRMHYVIGAAEGDARELARAPDLTGQTLHIEGHFMRSGQQPKSLSIRSKLANGKVAELSQLVARDSTGGRLEVHIERDLTSAFDGLDLSTVSPKELERGVLRNLISHTRVQAKRSAR